jgi:hypothetical protein
MRIYDLIKQNDSDRDLDNQFNEMDVNRSTYHQRIGHPSLKVADKKTKTDKEGNQYELRTLVGGRRGWYMNGKLHRTDGPAVIDHDEREWWVNGKLHRTDGPAVIMDRNRKEWRVNGELHRTDGPAIVRVTGLGADREWWVNGKKHRTAGPAVEYPGGGVEWWLNGQKLTFDEWIDKTDLDEKEKNKLIQKFG